MAFLSLSILMANKRDLDLLATVLGLKTEQ